jgi:hypothetical protein
VDPAVEQGREALDPSKSVPERIGHGVAAVLPGIGPWAAQVAETEGKQLGSGDYAGAAGTLAGNALLYAAPKAIGKLRSLSPEAKVNKLAFASGPDTADLAKRTLPNVERAVAKTGARSSVEDYLTNINTAKNDLNSEYANALGPNAHAQIMPAAISQRILALETPNMAKTAAGRAQAAIIRRAASEFQKPWTLGELDAERMEANSRLGPYEKQGIADQYSTLKKSRNVAIDKAIADGVRETVYPQMDRLAGKPVGYFASLKQQIGDLLQLQSKVDRQVSALRDKTARIKGAPAFSKAAAAEGAGSAAVGYKHGIVRTLARAVIPENPEKTANKRVARALGGRIVRSYDPVTPPSATPPRGPATPPNAGTPRAPSPAAVPGPSGISTPPAPASPPASAPPPGGSTTGQRINSFMGDVAKRHAQEAAGHDILDEMDERGESPRAVSDEFWAKTYFNMPAEAQQRMTSMLSKITGMKPGDVIAVRPDKSGIIANDWSDIAKDLVSDKVEYLQGTDRGYVALMKEANRRWAGQQSRKGVAAALSAGEPIDIGTSEGNWNPPQ